MAGEKRLPLSQQNCRVTAMHGPNLQHSVLREIGKENASLDLRLHDVAGLVIA
jgi:hypothetical protein